MKLRLLLIALLASFTSFGQENNCFENLEELQKLRDTSSSYRPESWVAAETQVEMNNGMIDIKNYSDSVLNVVYQGFHNILDCLLKNDDGYGDAYFYSEMKSEITQGQKAWIKTRDADAAFYFLTVMGGSFRVQRECYEIMEATNERTDKLLYMISFLTNEEGY
jgi:uncharacterized protein YecT (DUF1311 family)